MKKTLQIPVEDHVITLASEIVFGQRQEWCEAKYRQLKLSFMKPRCHYPYDIPSTYPLIVWICGGSFIEVDRNVWMPELTYFTKHGYAVASIEYGVTGLTRFPEQLEDVKQAIRFLRAHAEEFQIQPDHVAVMGESAGGYLTVLTALTGKDRQYDKGEYLDQSSEVQAALPWYPAVDRSLFDPEVLKSLSVHREANRLPALQKMVTPDAPPFMIWHGLGDTLVSEQHSLLLYNALVAAGVEATLYLVEDADHADHRFIQEESKAMMLKFLDSKLRSQA